MKILWIDPLNTDSQFLNLMSVILMKAGHDVHVRSIVRDGHPLPNVHWTPFMHHRSPPFP